MMNEKRFKTNDLVKFDYSEIGEYVDENHTDRPLRNDEVYKLLNELHEENQQLKNDCGMLVQSNQEYRKENEQLRKIGVMYQGHNPCESCTYSFENNVCCAEPIPISCDDAKKNFIQGLCKNHKQFKKSFRRYNDE